MGYEVTKRIKGRDYRYIVDSYRDPETRQRKARWQYVGAVENGEVRAGEPRPRKRVARDEIVAATARLLEFRDPEHITAGVIARSAGISRSTFYQHFHNQHEAITEALERIGYTALRAVESLPAPHDLQEAREQFRRWCETLVHSTGLDRAMQRALLHGYSGTLVARLNGSRITERPVDHMERFFQQLNDAGLASIQDPKALALAVKGMHIALRVSRILLPLEDELPLPEYDELYPLIEQAVFGWCRAAVPASD
jgi:AcrR family transcriptional regulator